MDLAVVPAAPERLTGDPAAAADRPLLTYYDDATGERTELTAAALGGWAARTAGLLRDGCGLGFVSWARLDDWLEDVPAARHRFVLGLAPEGAALREVPDGYRDYMSEVRSHPSDAPAYELIHNTDSATVDGTTYQEWVSVAQEVAASVGMRPGDRVLIDAAEHEQPFKWLLAPLSAGGSVVLCANLDPQLVTSRIAAEQVTRVL